MLELTHQPAHLSAKGSSLGLPTNLHRARTQPSSTSFVILSSSSLGQDSRAKLTQRDTHTSSQYPLTLLQIV